jgi:hypothetical protein
MYVWRASWNTLSLEYGTEIGNLIRQYSEACVEREELMIREAARDPFDMVATSLVRTNTTVVEKRDTSFTTQQSDPMFKVSLFTSDT